MKKIILTTEQLSKISDYVSNEVVEDVELGETITPTSDNSYEQECEFDLTYHGVTYKGMEIDDIEISSVNVNFNIDMEIRSWGIKGVYVHSVRGPEEVEMLIRYYPEGSDFDHTEVEVPLKINWDSCNEEDSDIGGYIGIDQEIELELQNDDNGDIVVKDLIVRTRSI